MHYYYYYYYYHHHHYDCYYLPCSHMDGGLMLGCLFGCFFCFFLSVGVGFDFGMLVKSCLCLGIFFTYPVMMFPVIKIMETYFLPDAGKSVWKAVRYNVSLSWYFNTSPLSLFFVFLEASSRLSHLVLCLFPSDARFCS